MLYAVKELSFFFLNYFYCKIVIQEESSRYWILAPIIQKRGNNNKRNTLAAEMSEK